MALIFWGSPMIERDERPVVALLLGTENGMYETNDSYCKAIEEAGGLPVQFGFDNVYDKLDVLKPDAILLPGGTFKTPDMWYCIFEGDNTINDRTKAYIDMLKYAEEHQLPLLAICAGMQVLAVKFCSLLLPKVEGHKLPGNDEAHVINIMADSLLADITGVNELTVNSRHNEAVRPSIVGDALKVVATSEDGVIEAIEPIAPWCEFVLGVQFHPEDLANKGKTEFKKIFQRFIEVAALHTEK